MSDERRTGDWSAVTTRQAVAASRRTGPQRVHTLTIANHPELTRIGSRVRLKNLSKGGVVQLSRREPVFRNAVTGRTQSLSDPFLSRRPVVLEGTRGGGVRIIRAPDRMPVFVNGRAVDEVHDIPPDHVEAGVVMQLSNRVVLVLHFTEAPVGSDPLMGMVGYSDAMARVRNDVQLMSQHEVPILIRGETGSGKELVARAIHAASARQGRAFVPVNMGAIPAETGASQLFGHAKGAFTGATADHPGYFGQADGGTLFLDEIGETPGQLQVMLLRALESGEVQPVGARRTRVVDARLISATDADLEGAVADGRFREPLLHRLAGFQIEVPPLRLRREDIGVLLMHFLTQELKRTGDEHRLAQTADTETSWLGASLVARLARYDWPGNVRQLRNVTRRIVLEAQRGPVPDVFDALDALMVDDRAERSDPEIELPSHESPMRARTAPTMRPEDIEESTLKAALELNKWRLGATARYLGIARSTLYTLIDRFESIRKAGDLTQAEIEAAAAAHDGDVRVMSEALQVSKQGLLRRMKQLGLS